MFRIITWCLLFAGVFAFITHTNPALAQLNTSATLQASPSYPEPNSEVTLTLEAYAYNLNGSSITWFINGREDVAARNQRELTLLTGSRNEPIQVTARLALANGVSFDVSRTLRPTRVDIVIEPETYAPAFYQGRPLPSIGSTIRAIALPVTTTDPQNLTYTWRVDNKTLYGGPLRGQDTAEFSVSYGTNALVSVEVADQTGNIFAKKLIEVSVVEPQIHFYEANPLRGLARNTLFNPHQLINDEITVRAEPYYIATDPDQSYVSEWSINGRDIQNPSSNQRNLTLRKESGNGEFRVEYHIRNLEYLLQGTRNEFRLVF